MNWFIRNIWSKLPFGYICRFWDGKTRVTITPQLWVIIDSGRGTVKDMLPLSMVSQELVDKVEEEMQEIGYKEIT